MIVVVAALAVTAGLFVHADPQIVTNAETGAKTLELANRDAGPWIALVLAVYMAAVALSICAVIWVLTPEIFPNRVRGRAMAIATLVNWGTNAASASLFPWYVDRWGMHAGFLTFCGHLFHRHGLLLALRTGNQRQKPGGNREILDPLATHLA